MNNQPANKYLDELITFGGIPHTRSEAIAILQSEGHDPRCIDRWLQGYEHTQRQQDRRNAIRMRLYVSSAPSS